MYVESAGKGAALASATVGLALRRHTAALASTAVGLALRSDHCYSLLWPRPAGLAPRSVERTALLYTVAPHDIHKASGLN